MHTESWSRWILPKRWIPQNVWSGVQIAYLPFAAFWELLMYFLYILCSAPLIVSLFSFFSRNSSCDNIVMNHVPSNWVCSLTLFNSAISFKISFSSSSGRARLSFLPCPLVWLLSVHFACWELLWRPLIYTNPEVWVNFTWMLTLDYPAGLLPVRYFSSRIWAFFYYVTQTADFSPRGTYSWMRTRILEYEDVRIAINLELTLVESNGSQSLLFMQWCCGVLITNLRYP